MFATGAKTVASFGDASRTKPIILWGVWWTKKPGGPPLFEPPLKVQRDIAHHRNSEVVAAVVSDIANGSALSH